LFLFIEYLEQQFGAAAARCRACWDAVPAASGRSLL
jgi:hypothetical protein